MSYGVRHAFSFIDDPIDCGIDTGSESLVEQHHKDSCDINILMANYMRTGLLEHVRDSSGFYADFSTDMDYQEMKNAIINTEMAFMGLPAHIRSRFENDPGLFIDFVHDPSNHSELVSMGLISDNIEKEIVPVESVSTDLSAE